MHIIEKPPQINDSNVILSENILSKLSVLSIKPEVFLEAINEYVSLRKGEPHEKEELNPASVSRINLILIGKIDDNIERDDRNIINLISETLRENNLIKKDIQIPIEEAGPQTRETESSVLPPKGTPEYHEMMKNAYHHEKENLPPAGHKEDEI